MKEYCECMDRIDAKLKAEVPNTMLVFNLIGPRRAVLATCKRVEKVRGKPAIVVATYCPFCGEKYINPDVRITGEAA